MRSNERERAPEVEDNGEDIVFQAVQYDNVELLVELLAENPALVEARDANGRTPLHLATMGGHANCAELIIRQTEADLDALSGIGDLLRSPLMMAAATGRQNVLTLLVQQGADLFQIDADGHSALQLAQMNGQCDCAHTLIATIEQLYGKAKEKNQRLCSASVDGDLATVRKMVAELGNGHKMRELRALVLNGSGQEQKSALFLAAEHGREEIVRAFLSLPAHSIVFEPSGDTVLHAAIASQHEGTVLAVLAKFPFLVAVPNLDGELPLHWAARCGPVQIVRQLLEWPHFPVEELKFWELTAENNTDERMDNSSTYGGKMGYLFPCDLNAPDQLGRSPLFLAVQEGHSPLVEYLAQFKMAIWDGGVSASAIVKMSVKHTNDGSADDEDDGDGQHSPPIRPVDWRNPFVFDIYAKNGRTPLMVACANGCAEIVRTLVEQGRADVNLPIALTEAETSTAQEAHCRDGSGALIEAAKRGNIDVLKLLFNYGAFDHENRALAQLVQQHGAKAELVGLFLEHLSSRDTEGSHPVNWPTQQSAAEGRGAETQAKQSSASSSVGALEKLSTMLLSGTPINPATAISVLLDWKAAYLEDLKLEWLVAASGRLNVQFRQKRSLALLAITRIDLPNNALTSVPAFLFTQLNSLHTLVLSENAIHRLELPIQNSQWQSPCLDTLLLDQNQIEELPAQLFSASHFPRLRSLSANFNRLARLPASIWTAPRLVELSLANNRLSELTNAAVNLFEIRRQQKHGAAAGAAAARISRQKQKDMQMMQQELNLASSIASQTNESAPRQSRSAKRESPSTPRSTAKSAVAGGGGGSSRRNSQEESEQQEQQGKRRGRGSSSAKRAESDESEGMAAGIDGGGGGGQLQAELDIIRLNIWQNKVQLSNIDDNCEDAMESATEHNPLPQEEDAVNSTALRSNNNISKLKVLNIAQNKFVRMPTCLACCCPRLTRLDMSANQLTTLGTVECLPSALRHLNVSGNKLSSCFVEPSSSSQLKQRLGRYCEAPGQGVLSGGGVVVDRSSALARQSRSRSKSVARSQRSLSVVRQTAIVANQKQQGREVGDDNLEGQTPQNNVVGFFENNLASSSGGGTSYCLHKSHCRLEALRTLNLANNELRALELMIPILGDVTGGGNGGRGQLNDGDEEEGNGEGEETMAKRRFNWKEEGERLKPYILFPSLSTLDVSGNLLRQLPPAIALLNSLSVLNLSNNVHLECLLPEMGLLDKLWNIGLSGCQLSAENPQLRAAIQEGNYKTTEVLSELRQRLENAIPYPKLKLMLLGGSGVGKSTLLKQMRLEGNVPKKSLQTESWSRRMGHPHSPARTAGPIGPFGKSTGSPSHSTKGRQPRMARSSSQQPPVFSSQSTGGGASMFPVDVAEWVFEPIRKSSSKSTPQSGVSKSPIFQGPITFRTWDFDGIKQKEHLAMEVCFFTRHCLYLLLWKVTDGEIALTELQEWLVAIQERAPNSSVLIVGTHSDFVREQHQRFPDDYLNILDRQIQDRFIVGVDPDKRGLPRVLGALYLSCRSRDDVKSLCNLIYTCAVEMSLFPGSSAFVGGGSRVGGKMNLADKVPASFVALEEIAVNLTDELRLSRCEPILHFQQFWTLASERLLLAADEECQQQQQSRDAAKRCAAQFRNAQDFRQACQFLHKNGVICYWDDTLLRDFVFLDPPWLCAFLHGTLHFASQSLTSPSSSSPTLALSLSSYNLPPLFSQIHQSSIIDSVELYSAMKQTIRHQFMVASAAGGTAALSNSIAEKQALKQFHMFRQCAMGLLRKFELALPFQNGKASLLASFLPDEYLLRADYPGAKVRYRTKMDKLRLRWKEWPRPRSFCANVGAEDQQQPQPLQIIPSSPIRSYLEHRRLSRTVANANPTAGSIDETGGIASKLAASNEGSGNNNNMAHILSTEQCKAECLRRLYVLHFIPPGFWPRLITRLIDDERLGNVLAKMFIFSRIVHQTGPIGEGNNNSNCSAAGATAEDEFLAARSAEALAAALSRTLSTAGRVLNLAAQRDSAGHHEGGMDEEAEEEEETSFIVVSTAEEATEEGCTAAASGRNRWSSSLKAAANGKEKEVEAPTVVKCCERGVEVSDEEEHRMLAAGQQQLDAGEGIEWLLWRTGLEVRALGTFMLSLRQFLPLASVQDVNYSSHQLFRRFEDSKGQWRPLTMPDQEGQQRGLAHMVELLVPKLSVRLKWRDSMWELVTDREAACKVLVLVGGIMDDLLEDWYPQLGTRFVHSSQGRLLVDRLLPCNLCAFEAIQEEERYWLRENINRNQTGSSGNNRPSKPTRSASTKCFRAQNNKSRRNQRMPKSKSSTAAKPLSALQQLANQPSGEMGMSSREGEGGAAILPPTQTPSIVYVFSLEETILHARRLMRGTKEMKNWMDDGSKGEEEEEDLLLSCPKHGKIDGVERQGIEGNGEQQQLPHHLQQPDLKVMAPDLLFIDLKNEWLIPNESVHRGRMLGRGAFGFVFTGCWSDPAALRVQRRRCGRIMTTMNNGGGQGQQLASSAADPVALKVLEPVEPPSLQQQSLIGASAQAAFRAFSLKWQNDALEQATKAYCAARQEFCMLAELRHPHCSAMLAFCPLPMTFVMELAPHGSLDKLLADHRHWGQRLHLDTLQRASVQIAKALEYLHVQQHIIYRDLKSENVLVWRFPLPKTYGRPKAQPHSAPSLSPSDVLLKLGDYGISRFSYPSGVCKGYGGTEGFMAPEIMRYSGEQEYTERVDCFSFGMFLYELLTLRQPYEGHQMQQMKERILERQRPTVSEKELLYPTNMLDLMVACWEESAELRPSSSQLVGICSAPEYGHLLDLALLRQFFSKEQQHFAPICAAICVKMGNEAEKTTPAAAVGQQWSCWMPMEIGDIRSPEKKSRNGTKWRIAAAANANGHQMLTLQSTRFGWTEMKIFSLSLPNVESPCFTTRQSIYESNVTVISQVYDDFVWLGTEMAQVHIYALDGATGSLATRFVGHFDVHRALENCPGQSVQLNQREKWQSEGHEHKNARLCRTSSSFISSSTQHQEGVLQIQSFSERQIVVLGLAHVVLLCRWEGREEESPVPTNCIRMDAEQPVRAMALLLSLADWQIWTGHAAGQIFMHHISSSTNRLAFSTSANHSIEDRTLSAFTFLVASTFIKNLVWSAMEYDSRVFQWKDGQLRRTLNCAKILPVSESLSSLEWSTTVNSAGQMSHEHFITAFELLNLDNSENSNKDLKECIEKEGDSNEQLLVGTNRGIVIIIRAQELSPITAFRPYLGPVERILSCPFASSRTSTSHILQQELLQAANLPHQNQQTPPIQSSSSGGGGEKSQKSTKKRLSTVAMLEKSKSIMLRAAGVQQQQQQQSTTKTGDEGMDGGEGGDGNGRPMQQTAVLSEMVDELCEAVKSGMRGIMSVAGEDQTTKKKKSTVAGQEGEEGFFVTIGTSYRPLLNRFVNQQLSSLQLPAAEGLGKGAGERSAIFWRATKHWSQSE